MSRPGGCWCLGLVVVTHLAAPATSVQGQLRKAEVGEKMKPFTLADIDGEGFSFQPERGRAVAVAFLAAHQTRSERALVELRQIAASQQRAGQALDLVVIVSGSENAEYFRELRKSLGFQVPMLVDRGDQLWGNLGITATPTVVVTDKEGVISWIRAGHAYDFAEEARSEVAQALGLEQKKKTQPPGRVEALTNDTPEDRARRHLRMGQLLGDEGRIDAAIAELKKAEALTPKSVEVQLETGRLLCRAGRSEEALSLVGKISPTTPGEEAEAKMLSGWAHRQLGHRDLAEKLLEESLRANPQSVRALYELGNVYRDRGEKEKAAEAYARALAIHFQEVPSATTVKDGGPAQHNARKEGDPPGNP